MLLTSLFQYSAIAVSSLEDISLIDLVQELDLVLCSSIALPPSSSVALGSSSVALPPVQLLHSVILSTIIILYRFDICSLFLNLFSFTNIHNSTRSFIYF